MKIMIFLMKKLKKLHVDIPIIIGADKNLKYRNIGAFRNLGNRTVNKILSFVWMMDFYFLVMLVR